MTDATFDAARRGDVAALMASLHSLPETDRRQLAPQAQKLQRNVRDAYIGGYTGEPWPFGDDKQAVLGASQLLFLGTATAAELHKVGSWGVPADEVAIDTLRHRPAVAAALVDVIAGMTPGRFTLIRALVREGIVERPNSAGYILAMINGLAGPKRSVLDALREDPDLLNDEVWGLFEVEGAGDTSLAAHDKYAPEAACWDTALKTLSDEGRLSRSRLLDASLTALARDFAPFRAGWFSRFHERLTPTRDERREMEAAYVGLLASPVPATVSFAVRALVAAGRLSDSNVERLAPALMSKATATVKGALKLLPKSESGAAVATAALPQATRDGQKLLLDFIKAAGQPVPAPEAAPVPARMASFAVPSLPEPVESVGDLVELLATLVEHIDNAYEIERALEATSRLCNRDELTLRRLDPVAKRAAKLLSESHPFAGESPRADIAGLVLAWATSKVPPIPLVPAFARSPFLVARRDVPGPRRSVLGFLSSRVREVAERAARAQTGPLLSLPTSAGGRIRPEVLASRRDELARRRIKPGKADAAQAALRGGEVTARALIRFRYESAAAKRFELFPDPPLQRTPDFGDVPGLFVAALSAINIGQADYTGIGRNGATGLAEAVRWVGTVWPANRELFYARGAADLGRNVDWWQAMWHVRCFLEPMLLPDEPIHEMGRLLLALGLAAKEPGERGLATDVMITSIGQGRVDAGRLGDTLGMLYDHAQVKGSRFASTLSEAARVTTSHADAVATVLERVLAGLHGPPPVDLHAVVTSFADALAIAGRPMRDAEATAYLAGIEGSGKAANAARDLVHGPRLH